MGHTNCATKSPALAPVACIATCIATAALALALAGAVDVEVEVAVLGPRAGFAASVRVRTSRRHRMCAACERSVGSCVSPVPTAAPARLRRNNHSRIASLL